MIIKLDKFFVKELEKNGVNFTYNELATMYSESRKDAGCVSRAKDNAFINSIGSFVSEKPLPKAKKTKATKKAPPKATTKK